MCESVQMGAVKRLATVTFIIDLVAGLHTARRRCCKKMIKLKMNPSETDIVSYVFSFCLIIDDKLSDFLIACQFDCQSGFQYISV